MTTTTLLALGLASSANAKRYLVSSKAFSREAAPTSFLTLSTILTRSSSLAKTLSNLILTTGMAPNVIRLYRTRDRPKVCTVFLMISLVASRFLSLSTAVVLMTKARSISGTKSVSDGRTRKGKKTSNSMFQKTKQK